MKVKGHTLVESLIALSIMAFISGATLLVINQVRLRTTHNVSIVYRTLSESLDTGKVPEATSGLEYDVFHEDHAVEGFKVRNAIAKDNLGRTILSIRKLIPEEE